MKTNKPSPEEALASLDRVAAESTGSREDHDYLQECVRTLASSLERLGQANRRIDELIRSEMAAQQRFLAAQVRTQALSEALEAFQEVKKSPSDQGTLCGGNDAYAPRRVVLDAC